MSDRRQSSEGMTYEEAEKNAVTDMGDPVEVGDLAGQDPQALRLHGSYL